MDSNILTLLSKCKLTPMCTVRHLHICKLTAALCVEKSNSLRMADI